jgi:hypothetical protein
MTVSRGIGRGGARPGAGRKRGGKNPLSKQRDQWLADIATKLALLAHHADRQQRRERAESEALVPILRRLTAIERRLGLVEMPQSPHRTAGHSRRHPLGRPLRQ